MPAFAVGALTVAVVAALANPEPFSKLGAFLGMALATAVLIFLGRGDSVPPQA